MCMTKLASRKTKIAKTSASLPPWGVSQSLGYFSRLRRPGRATCRTAHYTVTAPAQRTISRAHHVTTVQTKPLAAHQTCYEPMSPRWDVLSALLSGSLRRTELSPLEHTAHAKGRSKLNGVHAGRTKLSLLGVHSERAKLSLFRPHSELQLSTY